MKTPVKLLAKRKEKEEEGKDPHEETLTQDFKNHLRVKTDSRERIRAQNGFWILNGRTTGQKKMEQHIQNDEKRRVLFHTHTHTHTHSHTHTHTHTKHNH